MKLLYLVLVSFLVDGGGSVTNSSFNNSNDTNKDMYVIHAMVYQLGIITNSTDDLNDRNATGKQEALTFYHTNGSNIDLSEIPTPLITNITGQSVVALAPILNHETLSGSNDQAKNIKIRDTTESKTATINEGTLSDTYNPYPKSAEYLSFRRLLTRGTDNQDVTKPDMNVKVTSGAAVIPEEDMNVKVTSGAAVIPEEDMNVKVTSGAAVIPEEAQVHSVGIPSLLTFNNNLSEIPVPIPNTSIVQYSNINTLIKPSNKTL